MNMNLADLFVNCNTYSNPKQRIHLVIRIRCNESMKKRSICDLSFQSPQSK